MACRLIDNRLQAIRYSTICNSNYLSRRCIAFAFVSCHQNNSKKLNFYSAMQCVSAVFAVVRCLSFRQSRSCIVSKRLKISSNFFAGPEAHQILDWWGVQLATNNYVFVVRRTTLRIQEYLQKFIPQQDTGNSTNVAVDEFNVKVLRSELIRLSVAPCKLFSSMTLCLFLNPDFKLFFVLAAVKFSHVWSQQ